MPGRRALTEGDAPPGPETDEKSGSLTWSLADPGMGLTERAGLAALWLTLKAAERNDERAALEPLTWQDGDLTEDAVTVRWTGCPRAAFQKLMEYAWQHPGGVLYLPAVHQATDRANPQRRVTTHNGVFKTFLQHPRVQAKSPPEELIVSIEDGAKEMPVRFQRPVYPLNKKQREAGETAPPEALILKPHKDVTDLFDRKGEFKKTIGLSSWVVPGMAGRYGAEGAWEGPPRIALLLMLGPIGCRYAKLRGPKPLGQQNWVVVVPDVRDLPAAAAFHRREAKPWDAEVASLGDAALRFLSAANTEKERAHVHRAGAPAGCRVVAMGKVGYYANQTVRRGVVDVAPTARAAQKYRLVLNQFGNVYAVRKANPDAAPDGPPRTFVKIPTGRGRIGDNLAAGRPWYADLAVPLPWDEDELDFLRKTKFPGESPPRIWFRQLSGSYHKDRSPDPAQKARLMALIQDDRMWDGEEERLFVEAFWDSLRRQYHHEFRALGRGGERDARDRIDNLNEELRRRLMRCKTRTLTREFYGDFFSRGLRRLTADETRNRSGSHRPAALMQNPALSWALIDHPDRWQQARDLGLLALASYSSKSKQTGEDSGEADENAPTED
ncbi:type I-MYXAN CRISPR-associated Cas8a1/Cmx1 [Alienimonas sp. DA493]|uniref:type I-MYXAN CRISPR-associated Cas8a1/Cmx1 n=1 Tax=Alienimonas sp. DA493 TaxID=3373605 RepID=UPI0037542F8F